MTGAFLGSYGGDIKFQYGIKIKKFIVELILQKVMDGFKMKMF